LASTSAFRKRSMMTIMNRTDGIRRMSAVMEAIW
jgi:hypothetical protein